MAKTNKRVSHHVAYKRDMDLIFGKKKDSELKKHEEYLPKMELKGAKVGPSNDVLEKLSKRQKSFRSFNKVSGNKN